ncbi:MAG: hypothetical protein AAF170_10550 [Bacteroidota bacterium]
MNPTISSVIVSAALVLIAFPTTAQTTGEPPLTEPIIAFLGGTAEALDFGTPHPDASAELAHFGDFVGVWRTESVVNVGGQTFRGWPGTWAWRHAVGGYGIRDLFHQAEADLPPPMAEFKRDNTLLTTRVFDPVIGRWRVFWISNANGFNGSPSGGAYEAVRTGDRIVMTKATEPGRPLSRIVFSDIAPNSFTWQNETSSDDGATWVAPVRVEARRIR